MSQTGVPLLVGPTASGKTDLSLRIADRIPCEIVCADSRQIYRHMDIGTAKPTPEQRSAVAHHCIDILDPDADFSAGQYGTLACRIVHEIHARKRIPLVVGGSGLYIRALTDGIFTGNFKDQGLRERLNREADEVGTEALHERLRNLDLSAAEKIHSNDRKRTIRALEVIELSGQPLSRLQKELTKPADFPSVFFGLNWPRSMLYRRIEERVDRMISDGLVDEVHQLHFMGYSQKCNSMNSVGYKEISQYIEGHTTLEEAVALIKKNTRRFAKRQMTWFRSDRRIQWIDIQSTDDLDVAVDRIVGVVCNQG